MKSLLMMRPIEFSASGPSSSGTGLDNLLSPDPKEAFVSTSATAVTLRMRFASAQMIDTAFLAFTNLPDDAEVYFESYTVADGTGATAMGTFTVDNPTNDPRPRHAFIQLPAPISALGIRATMTTAVAGVKTVGVMGAGLAVQPFWGHEYGAGRFVIDTGTKERLLSGGFGIRRGARAGGYAWTFGDLSDAEVDALYSLTLDAGETGSVLVVENPDTVEPGLNERIHWALIDRIEQYERFAPGATRWSFKVMDWA